jgi:hypothetical protein
MTDRETENLEPAIAADPAPSKTRAPIWQKLVLWIIALSCFAVIYFKLEGGAAREGMSIIPYLTKIFGGVSWTRWLALMIPYSAFFFLVVSAVVWRVINWYNVKLRYVDILPIRGSSYILSIVNEQVGKGAMGLYLNRRWGVPGWEVGSSMMFIMFCEFFYLTTWALIGYSIAGDRLPDVFGLIPYLALAALAVWTLVVLFFRGTILPGNTLRDRPVFTAFRQAKPWHYLAIIALRSPAMIGAVVVYTLTLRLFGIEESFGTMLGYLPIIFFGAATPGPMRTVAITLWVLLFPGHEGEMVAFGFVQHNFFIFFNAAIGLLFLRRANRELFNEEAVPDEVRSA